MSKPSPIPLAMIICDQVIEDRVTGKKSLIGIFNNISVKKIPCQHPSINIFCVLTEGIGQYQGCLRCIKLDTNKTIVNINGPLPFPNRLAVVEFNFGLKNVVFSSDGEYIFELLCDNKLVISRKFTVSKIKPKKNSKHDTK